MRIVSYGAVSVVGRRSNQEDAFLVKDGTIVVSDGMGGHASGELASLAVIAEVERAISSPIIDPIHTIAGALREADRKCKQANDGRGATATVVVVKDEAAFIVHAGDTRCYHLKAGNLEQMTRDHGIGFYIDNAVGLLCMTETHTLKLSPGDKLVLTSDGVHDALDFDTLRLIVSETDDAQKAADGLVVEALAAGSTDNCTAIVAIVG